MLTVEDVYPLNLPLEEDPVSNVWIKCPSSLWT